MDGLFFVDSNLLTEDLQADQELDGVRVLNPFDHAPQDFGLG